MPRNKFAESKPKNFKTSLRLLFGSLKSYRFALLVPLVLAVASSLLTLLGPKILGNMTNSAVASVTSTGSLDLAFLKTSALQLLALYALVAVLSYFESYLLARLTALYTKNLREKIIEKLAHLPISYFDQHQFGDTLSILSNDVDVLSSSLSEELVQILTNLTTVVGCLIMMFIISPTLTLVALVVLPLSTFAVAKTAKRAQSHFTSQRTVLGKLNSHIEEDYSGQLIIKANSHVPASVAEFEKTNQTLYEDSWRAQFLGSLAFPVVHFFTNLGYVAICVLGGNFVLEGKLLVGGVQAFLQYVSRFNEPLTSLSQIIATVQQTLAAAERVFTFLAEPEELPDPVPAKTVSKVKGAIEFHDVCFSYDKQTEIIKHFSAKIAPGSQVAIVGPTGAGKTTIINLLMRFYDPDSGYITIDGVPTREMTRASVRALFGMVLQDTWLFSGSVKDNLAYGNPKATLKDIRRATSAAGIDHLIESMKGGYRAEISEDSDNISAGEKQLLTIARAMVENPPMLILD